jgi:hypothetical protein
MARHCPRPDDAGHQQACKPLPLEITSLKPNNHIRAFEVGTRRGRLRFPYAKADPLPTPEDPVVDVFVDEELGREGLTYVLASGAQGSVHVEQVLEYNRDPCYMR